MEEIFMTNEIKTTAESSMQSELPLQEATADKEQTSTASQEVDQEQQLKFGYVVGLRNNGQLYFDVTGKELGIVELLGLHTYAAKRVENMVATSQGIGDAISMEILARVDALTTTLQQLLNPAKTEETDATTPPVEEPTE
jgi:hypothetical protein